MSVEPRRLGKYELQTCIARGGMGEVWKALDTQLQRYVAIKLLLADKQQDPDFIQRFEREGRLLASLRHPNIVKIHDFAVVQSATSGLTTAYMVMDYVQGQTLGGYIRLTSQKGMFPSASDLVYLLTAISRAIDYAHQHGMIHRDIKPDNILLDQQLSTTRPMGEPVLTDFGIARVQNVSAGTMLGTLLGTPRYMAPEQAQGHYDDPRSDLYSLGIILYEMTTGITPFRGDTPLAILVQQMHEPPMPPQLINARISPTLSSVILKSIAKKPEERFGSASAMTLAVANALHVPSALQSTQPFSGPFSPIPAPSIPLAPSVPLSVSQFQTTPLTTPVPSILQQPPKTGHLLHKRNILFVLLAVLLLLAGTISWFTFFSHTTSTAIAVGTLRFSSSSQIASGHYDTLQITLHNIPDAPANHVYYAWLETPTSETDQPHWQLKLQNGTVQMSALTYTGYTTLLIPHSLFLITEEDSSQPPMVPFPALSAHRYYAEILNATTTTVMVLACPTDTSSMVCATG